MKIASILLVIIFSGCADYGVARYSIEPVIVNNQAVCCKINLVNGKEIGRIRVHLEKKDGHWLIDLDERNVKSFEGQQVAASVATTSIEAAANVSAVSAVIPVASTIIKGVAQ